MVVDGSRETHEPLRDLGVPQAFREETEDVDLAA